MQGVCIERGLMDWQIVQQDNGSTSIELAGFWSWPESLAGVQVYGRVVREADGRVVVPWTAASMESEQKWKLRFGAVVRGGLYRLETCLKAAERTLETALCGDMIHHWGVGDVFVIAGQSNSAGRGRDPMWDPPQPGVHLLRNSGRWDMATHPMNESTNSVHPENRETTNPGHSPYLRFAKHLRDELGYPIGLVQAALGGSPLKSWNPDEDGVLFHSMLRTLDVLDRRVRGVLWYQGCSDTDVQSSGTYSERFEAFVQHVRAAVDNPELPFLTVQLNRLLTAATPDSDEGWSRVREVQRQAAAVMPQVFVVPTLDCPLSDQIHNSSAGNLIIGERLARCALASLYGREPTFAAPTISGARLTEPACVELEFADVQGPLHWFEVSPQELPLLVVDAEGVCSFTDYKVSGPNTIHLTCERALSLPAYVHGGYGQNPRGTMPLDTCTWLPALAFYNLSISAGTRP